MPSFKIIGNIENREVIAKGSGIRELSKLKDKYGDGKWRKVRGRL